MKTPVLFLLLVTASAVTMARQLPDTAKISRNARLIFRERFDAALDPALWKSEIQPSEGSNVNVAGGKLLLQTREGVTVWLNKILDGNIMIRYKRTVIMQGGKFDRLSDLNQFWMAADPKKTDLFTRNGKLEEYDSLKLYYVGMGGNSNSTTRFRRYDGKGNRELIGELLDKPHLLEPNHEYEIMIIADHGEVSYWMDGKLYFTYKDPQPLTSGYFGFRSTRSNQQIDDLEIYQLP